MVDYSRRKFMETIGLAGGAMLVGCNCQLKNKPKLGIQLYTLRDEIAKDMAGAIQQVAEIGYSGVETYFLPDHLSFADAAKLFRQYNLEVLAMHSELPVTTEQKDNVLRRAETYQTNRVVWHGWPDTGRYDSMDKIKATIDEYNTASDYLQQKGLQLGLHNHFWEFEKSGDIYPFYYLLEQLNPEIYFEIDVYWVQTAGLDPVKVVKDFGQRAPLLHIKDGPAIAGKPVHKQVAIGQGNVNILACSKAAQKTADWLVVELDECESDIFQTVDDSYQFLTKNNMVI